MSNSKGLMFNTTGPAKNPPADWVADQKRKEAEEKRKNVQKLITKLGGK